MGLYRQVFSRLYDCFPAVLVEEVHLAHIKDKILILIDAGFIVPAYFSNKGAPFAGRDQVQIYL